MANIGIGSKIKFALNVTGLGNQTLKDDADFTVKFYAQQAKETPTAFYTVNKNESGKAFADETNDNIYHVICDTTTLSTGTLKATLEVTYTDNGVALKEVIPIKTDVNLVTVQ